MVANKTDHAAAVRYQADESPPIALSFGLGLQLAILCIAGIVLTPAIVIRAAGGTEAYLSWALFAGRGGKRSDDDHTGGQAGPCRGRLRAADGHLRGFHRHLRDRHRRGRPGDAGHTGRHLVTISVHDFQAAFAAATDPDTHGRRNGNHADCGHGDAHRLRHADASARRKHRFCSSAQRPCDNHPHRRHRAEGDGVGNLLSGLAGTVPNTTYSSSVSITELTGVAARSVGVAVGVVFIAMAFLPKALAVILAIPGPVAAAYITVLIAVLFVVGMRIVIQDGVDHRNGLIAGVSFWIGVGLQNGVIFPEYFSEFAGGLLQNGMTGGGLVAVLLTLMNQDRSGDERSRRRLLVVAHKQAGEAVLDFIAAPGTANLEDRIALLGEQTATASLEREVSLRLLRHLASSVRHQQYHDTDIVTIHVTPPDAVRSA